MAGSTTGRAWARWLRRALLGLIALLVLAATLVALLLGTSTGGRLALTLVQGFLHG